MRHSGTLIALVLTLFFSIPLQAEPVEETTTQTVTPGFVLSPLISVVNPSTLTLYPEGTGSSQHSKLSGLALFQVTMARKYLQWGRIQLHGLARVGYGFTKGAFEIQNRNGSVSTTELTIQWIPVSVGTRVVYEPELVNSIKPFLSLSGGMDTLLQAGGGSASQRGYFIPYLMVSPGLMFLDDPAPGEWFGGFTFSTSFFREVAGTQRLRGWSFDLGVNILL